MSSVDHIYLWGERGGGGGWVDGRARRRGDQGDETCAIDL